MKTSEKTKKKQSESAKKSWASGKRAPIPEWAKKNRSEAMKGKNNHFYGKTHTAETRAKNSEYQKTNGVCLSSEHQRVKGKRARGLERTTATWLETQGYDVFPVTSCDRIAIKDGKVYLVEFKPESGKGTELSQLQKTLKRAAGEAHIVIPYFDPQPV